MIYIIDHNDSFTHNVVHQFSLFDEVECDNYNNLNKKNLIKLQLLFYHQAQVVQKIIHQPQIFIKNLKVKKK